MILRKSFCVAVAVFFVISGYGCSPSDPEDLVESCSPPFSNAGEERTIQASDKDTPETVNLSAEGSTGNIVSYEWQLSEEVIGTEKAIAYPFPVGSHLVTLSVTNDCGLSDDDYVIINVVPLGCIPPEVTINPEDLQTTDTDGDGSEAVTLEGITENTNILSYVWKAGEEVIGTNSVLNHIFPVGSHIVTLSVKNECDAEHMAAAHVEISAICEKPTAIICERIIESSDDEAENYRNITLDASCSTGNIVKYQWKEGEKELGSGEKLTHPFSTDQDHFVTLIVENDCGETDQTDAFITAYAEKPNAAVCEGNIEIVDEDGSGDEILSLDGTCSVGNIVKYTWIIGSEDIGQGETLTVNFTTGIHLITLQVANDNGETDETTIYVNIIEKQTPCDCPSCPSCPSCECPPNSSANEPPVAVIADRLGGWIFFLTQNQIELDGSGSYDPDGDDSAITYSWYLIEGTTATPLVPLDSDPASGITLNLSGRQPGTYLYMLIVNDGVSSSEPAFVSVRIEEPDKWVRCGDSIMDAINALAGETDQIIAVEYCPDGPYAEQVLLPATFSLIGVLSDAGLFPVIEATINKNEEVIELGSSTIIRNLEITSKDGAGSNTEKAAIKVMGSDVTIENCFVADSYSDGISVEPNTDNVIIHHCELVNIIGGEGIVADSSNRLEVRDTRIENTDGTGLWLMDCQNFTISNNVLFANRYNGIDTLSCTGVIEHNTIVNPGLSDTNGAITIYDLSNLEVSSNLVYIDNPLNIHGVKITLPASTPFNSDNFSNNYIFINKNDPTAYYRNISWDQINQTNWPSAEGQITENPLFEDMSARNFRLNTGSPAINVGEATPEGNATDAGAEGAVLTP